MGSDNQCIVSGNDISSAAASCGCGNSYAPPPTGGETGSTGVAPPASASNSKAESNQAQEDGPNVVVLVVAIGVPVILAILVTVYYCFTRKTTPQDAKNVEGFDESKKVEAMEGSLSMADVPMPTSTDADGPMSDIPMTTSPPPES